MTTRRLAAILYADVVGYSRLMQADEIGTLRDLWEHRRSVVDPVVALHNGRVVSAPGDTFLAEFASVVDAVSCAVGIQRATADRNAPIPPERRLVFRIGINVGDIIVGGGQIFGDGVNIAARLEGLCEPGGLCLSLIAREEIRDKLPFAFADQGDHLVKNIARPVRAFGLSAATIAGLPEELVAADIGAARRARTQSQEQHGHNTGRAPKTLFAALAEDRSGPAATDIREALRAAAAAGAELDWRALETSRTEAVGSFKSPVKAVTFALRFQEAGGEPAGKEERGGFRVGIHLGKGDEQEARPEAGDLAKRVAGLAPTGGIWISEPVYRAVSEAAEFGFEYVGTKKLEGAEEPIEIYRVHGRDVAASLRPSPRRRSAAEESPSLRGWRDRGRERPAIAVLPFRNLSGDPDQDFFADGTTEDIITSLTRFRGIDVIARGSTFAFRDRLLPSAEVAQRLDADYVAHGSIRRSSRRVRVTIQLDEIATNRIAWAERYDRPLEDLFEIQDEIAELAVAAMAVTIEEAERARARTLAPESLRAYGLVLKGRSHLVHFTAPDTALARNYYRNALDAAPAYGRAFAEMSRTHSLDWRYSWSEDPAASLREALSLAVQAVECDQNDARGHAEIGFVRLYRKEHETSLTAYRSALALNPNDAEVIAEYADALSHAGEPDEALGHFKRAMRLNPFYPDQYLWYMAGAYFKLRAFEDVIACVSNMHNVSQGRRLLAASYAHLGRMDEARREADLIRAAQPGFSAESWARGIVPDRRQQDVDLFVEGLKRAGL